MARLELEKLTNLLNNNTVLSQLMEPLKIPLKARDMQNKIFREMNMSLFCMLGCLRHLQGPSSLRAYVQKLLHLTDEEKVPVAKSTFSDAMNCPKRHELLRRLVPQLVTQARSQLPDKLSLLSGLSGRSVYAVDGTYQQESCHYARRTPKQGGCDNPKGHCHLPIFDLRLGIPVDSHISTKSVHEITLLKEYALQKDCFLREDNALWVVDRAFVDAAFWDSLKQNRGGIEMITRLKDNMAPEVKEQCTVAPIATNEGVIKDE